MIAIILVTLTSILVSFFCSLAEASVYAVTPSQVEEMRVARRRGAERLAAQKAKIDESIAAILTLNTIANTLGGTLGGALVAQRFLEFGTGASAIYGISFTIMILYFAEIVPKTLGVTFPAQIAPVIAPPLGVLIRFLKPIVGSTKVLTRLIRPEETESKGPSENEILALAELGARKGTLLPDEARWAVNALKLNDISVRQVMTPRTVVYMLPADMPLSMVESHSAHWSYSRLPIVQNNNPDHVEGVVHRRDVFDELARTPREQLGGRTLRDLAQPARFVPETVKCNELLRTFIDERQQLLIVTNEYGGMEGVVSLEDVLEFILGEEIVDPHDRHVDMQEVARVQAERRMRLQRSGSIERSRAQDPGDARPPGNPPQ